MSRDQPPPFGPPWARGERSFTLAPSIVSLLLQIPAFWLATRSHYPLVPIVGLTVLGCLLLPFGRRHPGPTLVAVAALTSPGIALADGPPFAAVPLAFAVAGAILRGKRLWTWSTLGGLAVLGTVTLLLPSFTASTGVSWVAARLVIVDLGLCLIAGLAEGMRGRRERYRAAAREAAARRQSAAEAERLRIARELHDILAHSLSEISVQAGVGLHLFDSQPQQARDALAAIRATSGSALDEVRSVLGVLRDGQEPSALTPEPTLARLDELVDAGARRGVTVTVQDRIPADGADSPTLPAQAAMFRIVQEALTNVARHAGANAASVVLDVGPAWYEVEVTNPPGAGSPSSSDHVGRGLIGMRERAELLGGTLRAGPQAGGGWAVTARIPRRAEVPS